MDVFATFGPNGLPTGFWPQDGHGPPPPGGAVLLTKAQWLEFVQNPGARWWDGGAVLLYVAPAATPPIPTVTGNQWAFALGDLGLAAAWRAATAKSKDKDQIRIGLIARDTPLLATDPLLIRVAANAGTNAAGGPLIDVPTVFAKALTEAT